MKFGINVVLWTFTFTSQSAYLLKKIKARGFDSVEICLENRKPSEVKTLRNALQDHGLEPILHGDFNAARDLLSKDQSVRENGRRYLQQSLELCGALGAKILTGPIYGIGIKPSAAAPAGKKILADRLIRSLQPALRQAQAQHIVLALEPLARYLTNFINTAADALEIVAAAASPALGILLDTHHMNIEEKSPAQAIARTGKFLSHLHVCENDRGVPGSGSIDWPAIAQALRRINYDRHLVLESCAPGLSESAHDKMARESLLFLKRLFKISIAGCKSQN